jgi:carbamoylphosphate synthase large subunit
MAKSILSAVADSATDPDYLSILLQWGPGGLMLALVLSGILIPKVAVEIIKADRDAWRTAFDKEREAHQLTRVSLQTAQSQAGLALEGSKTLTAVLERLGHVPKDREGRM